MRSEFTRHSTKRGAYIETIHQFRQGHIFLVIPKVDSPEAVLSRAVLEFGADKGLALVVVAKLEGKDRSVIGYIV